MTHDTHTSVISNQLFELIHALSHSRQGFNSILFSNSIKTIRPFTYGHVRVCIHPPMDMQEFAFIQWTLCAIFSWHLTVSALGHLAVISPSHLNVQCILIRSSKILPCCRCEADIKHYVM
jgi:hypothetical protein